MSKLRECQDKTTLIQLGRNAKLQPNFHGKVNACVGNAKLGQHFCRAVKTGGIHLGKKVKTEHTSMGR